MKRDRQPGISLCMIVRDEEPFIEACLRSAMPYVAEMIVCDTGSQDRTPDIAEGLGARVVRMEWNDHFAEARNGAIALASEPWILVLDADERLEPAAAELWNGLLTAKEHAGYCVRLVSALARTGDDRDETSVTDAVCRLFRNDPRIRFEGIIHEECATAVASVQGFAPAIVPVTVRHEGYRANVIEQRRKPERNMRLLMKAMEREPDNAVLRYAAGTELLGAGRWGDAVQWLMPLTESPEDRYGFASDVRLKLSHALRMAGCPDEAAVQALAGIRSYPDCPDLYEALAVARLEQDDAGAALAAYEQAIAIGEAAPHYSSVEGAGSYRSMYGAGAACERLYRWREAAGYYVQALQVRPVMERAWTRLLLLLQCDRALEPVAAAAVERLAAGSETLEPELRSRATDLLLKRVELEIGGSSVGTLRSVLLSGLSRSDEADARAVRAEGQRVRIADEWLAAARRAGAPLPSGLEFAALLHGLSGLAEPVDWPLRVTGCEPYERELAEALLATAAGRFAAASAGFAAARAAARSPVQARAAAAGLAAAFAARADGHAAAVSGSAIAEAMSYGNGAHSAVICETKEKLELACPSVAIDHQQLHCWNELLIVGLAALFPA